jgi:hypothetical protein
MDGSPFIHPIWGSQKTILGAANTLMAGDIRDVVCKEIWAQDGGLVGPLDFVRAMAAIWMNPPDPSVDFVQWWPNYISGNGYNVVILGMTLGDQGDQDITYTTDAKNPYYGDGVGVARGPLVLQMRLISQVT